MVSGVDECSVRSIFNGCAKQEHILSALRRRDPRRMLIFERREPRQRAKPPASDATGSSRSTSGPTTNASNIGSIAGKSCFDAWYARYHSLDGHPGAHEASVRSLTFAANPLSVRDARQFVAEGVFGVGAELRDIVVLLTSELVTNAIIHGGPHEPEATVGVAVEVSRHRVRVEVADAGAGRPRLGDSSPDEPGGRGLVLVEALASRWGCDCAAVGKCVWFEVDTPLASSNTGGDDE